MGQQSSVQQEDLDAECNLCCRSLTFLVVLASILSGVRFSMRFVEASLKYRNNTGQKLK